MGAFQNVPWQQIPPTAGIGPISPLIPQQMGLPQQMPFGSTAGLGTQQYNPATIGAQTGGIPFGGGGFGTNDPSAVYGGAQQGQYQPNPFEQLGAQSQSPFGLAQSFGQQPQYGQQPQHGGAGLQQSWQQGDPRAELVATAIAQITATRDPRIDYLSKVVVHPLVASNPVLKDLVAKELLTAALQQVTIKSAVRPDLSGQTFARGGEQLGFMQQQQPNPAFATGFPTVI